MFLYYHTILFRKTLVERILTKKKKFNVVYCILYHKSYEEDKNNSLFHNIKEGTPNTVCHESKYFKVYSELINIIK